MKLKFIFSFLILSTISLINLNAFAYKYAAHVTIDNKSSENLFISFSGSNNINKSEPFVSSDNQNPDTAKLYSISGNSKLKIL